MNLWHRMENQEGNRFEVDDRRGEFPIVDSSKRLKSKCPRVSG